MQHETLMVIDHEGSLHPPNAPMPEFCLVIRYNRQSGSRDNPKVRQRSGGVESAENHVASAFTFTVYDRGEPLLGPFEITTAEFLRSMHLKVDEVLHSIRHRQPKALRNHKPNAAFSDANLTNRIHYAITAKGDAAAAGWRAMRDVLVALGYKEFLRPLKTVENYHCPEEWKLKWNSDAV